MPLFFEDVNVTFSDGPLPGEADIAIALTAELGPVEEQQISLEASAQKNILSTGASLHSRQRRVYTAAVPEDEHRKVLKQSLSRVLLDVLQQHTGLVQPWGILTGISPTKLLHERMCRGADPAAYQAGTAGGLPDKRRKNRVDGRNRGTAAGGHS
ncbi:hypothetical protein [Paenibacillus beijingensis]|uniref:Uncharacterized protein n=1 Tax=Paenibacillus beijingensis TaxID=1126833 RepID=A0A0D5NMD6_9BACL|nr:hypothetical protein [Paenibacillus beijingensis]AJY76098.1 hypothetical protein VN24_17950 [Paenibacillus beijingensis]